MEEKEQIRKAVELLISYTANHDCGECILLNDYCQFFEMCPIQQIGQDESIKKFLTNKL